MKKMKTVFAMMLFLFAAGNVANGMILTVHVNVNKASYHELLTVPFVCCEAAKNIVEYRFANGSFKSLNDLLKVEGVTPNMLEQMKPFITLNDGPGN